MPPSIDIGDEQTLRAAGLRPKVGGESLNVRMRALEGCEAFVRSLHNGVRKRVWGIVIRPQDSAVWIGVEDNRTGH